MAHALRYAATEEALYDKQQRFVETNLEATESHLPYGIMQFYLPPDTSECNKLTPARQVKLDTPTPKR